MTEDTSYFVIGKIVSSFGIKGEVKVLPLTDEPEYFDDPKEFRVTDKATGSSRTMQVQNSRLHKGSFLVKFSGVDDIDTAETLRDAEVSIPESDLRPLGENEYLVADIIGLHAWTTEGEDLGIITEIIRSPANDVYATDRAMIPAVREFVEKIDLQDKKMIVRHMEGLLR
jgi:16S rRNA processing protein RimM